MRLREDVPPPMVRGPLLSPQAKIGSAEIPLPCIREAACATLVAAAAETLRARRQDDTAETLFVIAEEAADIIIKDDRGQLTI